MSKAKPIKLFMSRVIFVVICILLQLIWLSTRLWNIVQYSQWISIGIEVASVVLVMWIVSKRDNPAYKLIWTIVILVVPAFGVVLYWFCGRSRLIQRHRKHYREIEKPINDQLIQDHEVMADLEEDNLSISRISKYIHNMSGCPVYKNSETEYYPTGEEFFEVLKVELEKAEHFIFMEYFSVQEGYMWDTILEILLRKSKEKVEVRFIYDDMGCVALLPTNYHKKLTDMGIECRAFNPFIPVLSVAMNHRDHRKITVIDGHIGFTGGVNLTDSYINVDQPYGLWKDAAILVRGEAVWNLTVMFLKMWNCIKHTDVNLDVYKPESSCNVPFTSDGFVQPYDDSPLDGEAVGENVYLSMINRAKDYIYIYTPYLIIDNEMMTALCLAAKSGVDVRLMMPHIPDKKMIFLLTQSYYEQLIDNGVRIFEFKPGFLHSKCFLCDGEMGSVGTINLDYRSLYHHFECGVFIYKTKSLLRLKKDFDETFLIGVEMTKEFCIGRPWHVKLTQTLLRLAAPML